MLFAEGSFVSRPPMFRGMNYGFWKIRMKIFIESIDLFIWEDVVHGPYVPMQAVKDEEVVKPRFEWNETERKKAQYDLGAKNIITVRMDGFKLEGGELFKEGVPPWWSDAMTWHPVTV